MRYLLVVAWLAVAVIPVWAGPAQPDPLTIALEANETKILNALRNHDAQAFQSMVTADGWSVDGMGVSTMKDFTPMIKDMKFEDFKMSNLKVMSLGKDAALLTYMLDMKASMHGHPFPPKVYATTVYTHRGGKWQAVFHQESTAEKPPAPPRAPASKK